MKTNFNNRSGFTLIEIIFVISIIGLAYFVAIPQFQLASGTEVAVKIGQVAADIRSAFDTAVLTAKPYRMVFNFASGEYWLEVADRQDVFLADAQSDRDPDLEEQKNAQALFEDSFQEYVDIVGEGVKDPTTDSMIKPSSPLLKAKNLIKPVQWSRVDNLEWQDKSLGAYLIIQDMQAEHHVTKQSIADMGEKAHAMLYFFPRGYVERAVIHIAYRKSGIEIDESKEPYSVITSPYEGTAEVISGYAQLAEKDEKM